VTTPTSIRFEPDQLPLVDAWAAERGCTRNQLILHALDKVLAGHGKLDPEGVTLSHDERRALVAERRVARGDIPVPVSDPVGG
jgi:hypothetical protein